MVEHNWHEHRFEVDGELNGFRCSVQEYKCRNCGIIIELPMGVKANDYPSEGCRNTNSDSVYGLQKGNRLLGTDINNLNRHGLRSLFFQGKLPADQTR